MGLLEEITSDNIWAYEDWLTEDVRENIGRKYYRGLGIMDDSESESMGAIVWEYKNLDENAETECEIVWFDAKNDSAAMELLSGYTNKLQESIVKRSFFELPPHKEFFEDVFTKQNFKSSVGEGRDVIVTLEEITEISVAKKKPGPYVTSIKAIKFRQFRKGVTDCLFYGSKGNLEDFAFLPMSWYDTDVSCCILMDETVKGYLLIHLLPTGILRVEYLFAFGADYKKDLLEMLAFSIRSAYLKYPGQTPVMLCRHNVASYNLVSKLFPKVNGPERLSGERLEVTT